MGVVYNNKHHGIHYVCNFMMEKSFAKKWIRCLCFIKAVVYNCTHGHTDHEFFSVHIKFLHEK